MRKIVFFAILSAVLLFMAILTGCHGMGSMGSFERFHYDREMALAHGFDLYEYEADTQGLKGVE